MTLNEASKIYVGTDQNRYAVVRNNVFTKYWVFVSQTIPTIISGAIDFIKDGAGVLTLTGANTYTGSTTVSSGTLEMTSSIGAGTYSGNIAITGKYIFNSSTAHTFSGVISGTGQLEKRGSAQLTLTNSNNFTGSAEVITGILRLQNAAANSTTLGGNVTVTGAGRITYGNSLQLSTSSSYIVNGTGTSGAANIDFSTHNETINSINMTSGWLRRAAGSLTLLGSSIFSGGTIDYSAPGSRVITTATTTTLGTVNFLYSTALANGNATQGFEIGNILVNDSANPTFTNTNAIFGRINLGSSTRTITVGTGATMSVNWIIVGTGGLTKSGTGTLALGSPAHTYSGATNITAGTVTRAITTGASTATGTFTSSTLSISFNVAPPSGTTNFKFFNGSTINSYASVTLSGVPVGTTATYTSSTSTLAVTVP